MSNMKKVSIFLIILLFFTLLLSMKASGQTKREERRIRKQLATTEKYIVRDREAKRFERKQLPRPKEWRAWSIGLFVFTGIVLTTKNEFN